MYGTASAARPAGTFPAAATSLPFDWFHFILFGDNRGTCVNNLPQKQSGQKSISRPLESLDQRLNHYTTRSH